MQDLRIAMVQMNCRVAEHERNLATIQRFAEEAAAHDVDIVCFPELCVCGYNAGRSPINCACDVGIDRQKQANHDQNRCYSCIFQLIKHFG